MTTRIMLEVTRLEGHTPVASRTMTLSTIDLADLPHEVGQYAVKAARALLNGEAPPLPEDHLAEDDEA